MGVPSTFPVALTSLTLIPSHTSAFDLLRALFVASEDTLSHLKLGTLGLLNLAVVALARPTPPAYSPDSYSPSCSPLAFPNSFLPLLPAFVNIDLLILKGTYACPFDLRINKLGESLFQLGHIHQSILIDPAVFEVSPSEWDPTVFTRLIRTPPFLDLKRVDYPKVDYLVEILEWLEP